jgi:hypothetical protein
MAIERKFFRGQRVLTDDTCKASTGRPGIRVVIYEEYLVPNTNKKEPAYLCIMLDNEDGFGSGLNWYFESELTLWCSNTKKGEAIIKKYKKENG